MTGGRLLGGLGCQARRTMGKKVLGFSIPTAARTIRRMDTALFHRAEAIRARLLQLRDSL